MNIGKCYIFETKEEFDMARNHLAARGATWPDDSSIMSEVDHSMWHERVLLTFDEKWNCWRWDWAGKIDERIDAVNITINEFRKLDLGG